MKISFLICFCFLASHFLVASDSLVVTRLEHSKSFGKISLPEGSILINDLNGEVVAILLNSEVKVTNELLLRGTVMIRSVKGREFIVYGPGDNLAPYQSFFLLDELGQRTNLPARPLAKIPYHQAFMVGKYVLKEPVPNTKLDSLVNYIFPGICQLASRLPVEDELNNYSLLNGGFNSEFIVIKDGLLIVDHGNSFYTGFVFHETKIGGIVIPAGTRFNMRKGPDYSFSTISAESFSTHRGTSAAPFEIWWSHAIKPESYVIADTFQTDVGKLPPLTRLIELDRNSFAVNPPRRMMLGGIPLDKSTFAIINSHVVTIAWVAEEWKAKGKYTIPKGSEVHFSLTGTLREITLPDTIVSIKINGFEAQRWLNFNSNEVLVETYLAKEDTIQSVMCQAGPVAFHNDGSISGCYLARPQSINSIRLQRGWFSINDKNELVVGILDQDFTLGTTTYRRGDVFNGFFSDEGVFSILNEADVKLLKKDVYLKLDSIMPMIFLDFKKTSPFFGSFGIKDIKLKKVQNDQEAHAFVSKRVYAIENFLSNPPFNDCDCEITITMQIGWAFENFRTHKTLNVFAEAKPGSSVRLGCNFCPIPNFLLTYVALLQPSITLPRREIMKKTFSKYIDAKQEELFRLLVDTKNACCFEVVDLYLEKNMMFIKSNFLRSVWRN